MENITTTHSGLGAPKQKAKRKALIAALYSAQRALEKAKYYSLDSFAREDVRTALDDVQAALKGY